LVAIGGNVKNSAVRTLEQVEASLRSRARGYQADHGPRRGRYPDEFKQEIVPLLRAGIDPNLMASRIEIPKNTIQNWQEKVSLTRDSRPPCRPLRVVEDLSTTVISERREPLPKPFLSSCVIRLPGGVEIALGSHDVDERLLRIVMGAVS
jgi:transposase-like protein